MIYLSSLEQSLHALCFNSWSCSNTINQAQFWAKWSCLLLKCFPVLLKAPFQGFMRNIWGRRKCWYKKRCKWICKLHQSGGFLKSLSVIKTPCLKSPLKLCRKTNNIQMKIWIFHSPIVNYWVLLPVESMSAVWNKKKGKSM